MPTKDDDDSVELDWSLKYCIQGVGTVVYTMCEELSSFLQKILPQTLDLEKSEDSTENLTCFLWFQTAAFLSSWLHSEEREDQKCTQLYFSSSGTMGKVSIQETALCVEEMGRGSTWDYLVAPV